MPHPSMLTKQPRGTVNLATTVGTFCLMTTRIVTGSAAALEAVPQAVIHAWEAESQYVYGLIRQTA